MNMLFIKMFTCPYSVTFPLMLFNYEAILMINIRN